MPNRFAFASPGRPIVLEVSAEEERSEAEGQALVAALEELLPEWRAAPSEQEPVIRVGRDRERFFFSYPGAPDGEVQAFGLQQAADALAAALGTCLAQQNDRWLQVHAGAIALPRGYLLLIGDRQAGKSSLASIAAHLGAPLVSDDRIVLDVPIEGAPEGIALGTAPRLRQPLPQEFGDDFLDFARERIRPSVAQAQAQIASGLRDDYALLGLARPVEQLAAGSRRPVLALVSLERRPGGAIEFSPLGRGAALKGLHANVDAPHLQADVMTRRLHKLVRRVPAHSLAFARSRETASLLLERFGRD